jgi:hypothetical protein
MTSAPLAFGELCACRPVMCDDRGRHGGKQRRFIADVVRVVFAQIGKQRALSAPAIAARQKERFPALRFQPFSECDCGWRLARAAERRIADAEHRDFRPISGSRGDALAIAP